MKMKRFAAIAAVSMLGIQLMGLGTAFAAPTSDSDCDFGSDSLEITLGQNDGGDKADVEIYIDADGILYCDTFGSSNDGEQAASTIDSLTVEMDDDDSDAQLTIYLDDSNGDAAEWPDFDTFDIDVTTTLIVDGSSVNSGAANRLSVKFGKSTFSFSGTSGSYSAPRLDITGGSEKDLIDASAATVKVTADGGDEDDVIKGGSGNDTLTDSSCDDGDVLYGNGGNDTVHTCGTYGQAWGGAGNDDLSGATVAPGAGNDDVDADTLVTYADLTDGVEVTDVYGTGFTTSGAAGDDDLTGTFGRLAGSQGDDVLIGSLDRVLGNAGDDVIKCSGCDDAAAGHYASGGAGDDLIAEFGSGDDNAFFGNAGNDVLKGKDGDDALRGGPGSDQAWGGTGSEDSCTAEVTNRCEYAKL